MEILLGVILVLLGGFANGTYYMPFKKVKTWAWEVFWIVGGVFSWIIAPWGFSFFTVPDLMGVFSEASTGTLLKPLIFGILWGIGGLTFGLSMRYLGMSLGFSIALGLTLVFGSLLPSAFISVAPGVFEPLFPGTPGFGTLVSSSSGLVTLLGVLVCLFGIGLTGKAGMMKDGELSADQKQEGVKDFDFKKGIFVAIFSGLMSAAFAMGVAAGKPLAEITAAHGANSLFLNNPSFILIMFGGFLVNAFWTIYLMIKNKTANNFGVPPLAKNYILCATAGVLWYLQMFFYGMGESIVGQVAGWSLLMTSSIIFSNMWGILLKEWSGVKRRTMQVLMAGLLVLILSTLVFSWGKAIKIKEDTKCKQEQITME